MEILKSTYTPLQSDPLQALTRNGILFVKDQLGTRLDLLLSDTEFDSEAVRHGVSVELEQGLTAHVCCPEDLVIYKLISARSRDHEDAEHLMKEHPQR